jgi:glutamate synthase domain-containing protein 3
MEYINAENMTYRQVNELIAQSGDSVKVSNCLGLRFLCTGLDKKTVELETVSGNALGAYLDGATIIVRDNAQDAVGDTMNCGSIIVHGNAGDTLGYAMRGGNIFVKGNSGYRTGIHMKAYGNTEPVIIIGGKTGSFLGEYLAGGIIAVLGIGCRGALLGNFTGTGMHGGRIYLRTDKIPDNLPTQVLADYASDEDMAAFLPKLKSYCEIFGFDFDALSRDVFVVLKPNAKNPYKNLYVIN